MASQGVEPALGVGFGSCDGSKLIGRHGVATGLGGAAVAQKCSRSSASSASTSVSSSVAPGRPRARRRSRLASLTCIVVAIVRL